MVGWALLLVLIVAGLVFLLLQRMFYEHKIKTAQRGLAGKVCMRLSHLTTTATTVEVPLNKTDKLIVQVLEFKIKFLFHFRTAIKH